MKFSKQFVRVIPADFLPNMEERATWKIIITSMQILKRIKNKSYVQFMTELEFLNLTGKPKSVHTVS